MAKQDIALGGVVKDEVKKVNDNFDELYQKTETIPNKTSELTNDSNFTTETQVTQAINDATSNLPTTTEMNQAIQEATGDAVTETEMNIALGNKVDKETGKGLYPNMDATKVGRLGKIDFSTSDFGTAQTDGYVYATIAASGKYPVKVMKSNGSKYEEVLVQTSVEGNNIVIGSKTAFAGYVVTI